jgi:EAL domain-containing protein (putative c-di-GMP-specific phosphodiesterase class I)
LIRLGERRGIGLSKDWPWLLGVALFVGVAICIAAFALGSGTTTVSMLSFALIALALAQLVGLLRGQFQTSDANRLGENQQNLAASVMSLTTEQRRLAVEQQSLNKSLVDVRHDTAGLQNGFAEGLTSLRHSHEALTEDLRQILDTQKTIQQKLDEVPSANERHIALQEALAREQQWMAHLAAEPVATAPAEVQPQTVELDTAPFGEALNLALEPIVDLYTSNTAHYRMVLGMTNEQGQDIAHDVFVHHADRMGLRDSLDVHVVGETLALLEQLRLRDPNLSIFVPIGSATLANPRAIEGIISNMRAAPNQAPGVVIDLAHAVLASLPETSLEGLATLARAGVNLSLSQAFISGVDLAALNRLNVRFVSLAASSIGVGAQMSAGLPGFVQAARALRIQVIVSQVGDPRHVPGLARTARFASGPAFALPRKLKRSNAGEASQVAAA